MKALLALALTGCMPTLIWSGHTADRRHAFQVVTERAHQRVIIDGVRGLPFTQIAAWSMQTAGSRMVYAAQLGTDWVVVDPGRTTARWDGIGELAVSGPHTAYVAERAGRWHVVVDGTPGRAWDAVLASTLQWSRSRVVYVARDARGAHVVVDGAIGEAWDGVANLTLSADHVAYIARRGAEQHVVFDGVAGPPYRDIAHLAVADRAIYAARDIDGWHVVATEVSPAYREVRTIIARGAHAAWIADDLVTCDGVVIAHAPATQLALVADCDVVYATRDGRVVRSDAEQREVIAHGGAEHHYDEVGRLVVGPGGKVAFAARTGGTWSVVVDGMPHAAGSYAGEPVFSADGSHLAYVARRGRRWVAVVDDRAFAFDLVVDGSLAFSDDGRHWAVLAGELAREQLYFAVDGTHRVPVEPAEIYSSAERSTLGEDGSVLRAWAAAEANR